MIEILENLLELQEIDNEIVSHERSRDQLPQKIAQFDTQITEMEDTVNRERALLDTTQQERRRLERELSISDTSRQKYETQLLEVTTAREYTALQHEIDSERRKSAKMEEEILSFMEQIDEQVQKIENLEKEFQEKAKDIQSEKETLQKAYNSIDDKLKYHYELRKKVLIKVKPDVLSVYNRIWNSRRTPVVVPIKKSACSGCYRTLPPQEINIARKRERLITCEGCGRIIYWPDETNQFV